MRVNLEVNLIIDGNRLMQSGEFFCRRKEEIPTVALGFIKEIKMATGYRETIIEKITVNGQENITEIVKRL
jgi:hypothetical protein